MIRAIENKIKSIFGKKKNQPEPARKKAKAEPTTGKKEYSVKKSPSTGNRDQNKSPSDRDRHKLPRASGDQRTKNRRYKNTEQKKHKPPVFDQKPKNIPKKPAELIIHPEEPGKKRFADLVINEDILFGLQEMDFKYCTPIQEKSLPSLLEGKDVTGKAQTGTGKTAAFLVSTFNHLLNNPREHRRPGSCRALVLAPTRELAMQIYKDAQEISLFTNMNNLVVFGGMDHHKQRDMLNKPIDILIGTPGRIIDYSRSRHLDLSHAEVLIIDEADRMLDMGFIPDVKRIVNQLPGKEKRQTMLFSATLEPRVLRLASAWLKDPVTVESESEQLVTDLIDQQFYTVPAKEKLAFTLWVINNEKYDRILIFGNRKDRNLRLQNDLQRYGVSCALLSGDIDQRKRIKILENFRSGKEKIVIATDVAARGIHVDDVSVVINYDLPERAEDYVHRIGRTGRAGNKGKSVSLVCEYGAYSVPEIEKLLKEEFSSIYPSEEMVTLPPKPAGIEPPRSESRPRHKDNHKRPRRR